jgi:hypothetical protein
MSGPAFVCSLSSISLVSSLASELCRVKQQTLVTTMMNLQVTQMSQMYFLTRDIVQIFEAYNVCYAVRKPFLNIKTRRVLIERQ